MGSNTISIKAFMVWNISLDSGEGRLANSSLVPFTVPLPCFIVLPSEKLVVKG